MTEDTNTNVEMTAEEAMSVYDTAGKLFKDGKRDEALAMIKDQIGDDAAKEAEAVMAAVEKHEASMEAETKEEATKEEVAETKGTEETTA